MSSSVIPPPKKLFPGIACFSSVFALCAVAFTAEVPKVGWDQQHYDQWTSPVAPNAIEYEGNTVIHWRPTPFKYRAGDQVRYIDYENGDDSNSGTSTQEAWKHHPWDAEAKGIPAADNTADTYVFKGGVVYRGSLKANRSGTLETPLRLTRNPTWGEGKAIISGAEVVTGWKKADRSELLSSGIPESAADSVWVAKVNRDERPWALWTVNTEGEKERQTLARWPNWKPEDNYDLFTQWHRVESIEHGYPLTTIFAPSVLTETEPDAFEGAVIWVDHANTSEEFSIVGPTPSGVGRYNPEKGSLQPFLRHPRRHPVKNSPFFLENHARFLDEPGEWFYSEADGNLFFWPPEGVDPENSVVELARDQVVIDLPGHSHIEISGLQLTGGNTVDLRNATNHEEYTRTPNNAQAALIRLVGNVRDVDLSNLELTNSAGAGVVNLITAETDVVDGITIRDSEFTHLDNDGIDVGRGFVWRSVEEHPKGRLTNLKILRNRLFDIGMRANGDQNGKGINVVGLEVGDIAGNVIERTAAQGINLVAGRPFPGWMGEHAGDTPLIRIQVRHNQVKEPLMLKTDFGGIEFWEAGPAYIYGNVVIDPVGFIAHRGFFHKDVAYYIDHGFKGFLFNNIGWSSTLDDGKALGSEFFKTINSRMNMAFHNTSYNFRRHYSHESRGGDQRYVLANLGINADSAFQSHNRLQEAVSISFADNLYSGKYPNIYERWRGDVFPTIEAFGAVLKGLPNVVSATPGWVSDPIPVRDPKARDFRPTDDSATIDRGVRVFVPWSLYGVVGEWYFRHMPDSPNRVLSYDLFPQTFHRGHQTMDIGGVVPVNDLEAEGLTAENYTSGVLENWNKGALVLKGDTTLRIPHERLVKDFAVGDFAVSGADRKTVRMDSSNFLIEAVLRVDEQKQDATIARLMDETAGYSLGLDADGHPVMLLKQNGQTHTFRSEATLSPGVWHHLIAEVDRAKGNVTFYTNGSKGTAIQGAEPLNAEASLLNQADFEVGTGFHGALEFLRVSRGTLEDAQTSIEELLAWQFNGPHMHDFAGQPVHGEARDVGALENTKVSGQQPIVYTPPKGENAAGTPGSADEFLTGEDRTVQQAEWGTLSVPIAAKPGQQVRVQVAFTTEALLAPMVLRFDFHGEENGRRVSTIAKSEMVDVMPGVTRPYSVDMTIPERNGLGRMFVTVYAAPGGQYDQRVFGTEAAIQITTTSPSNAKADVAQPHDFLTGEERKVKDTHWGQLSIPSTAAPGGQIHPQVKFADGAISGQLVLRFDLHGFANGRRIGVIAKGAEMAISPNDSHLTGTLTVPERDDLERVAVVAYVGPAGGGWDDRVYSTEEALDISTAEPPTRGAVTDGERESYDCDWAVVLHPGQASVGERVNLTITPKDGVVNRDMNLRVDTHWNQGPRRNSAGGPSSGLIALSSGHVDPIEVHLAVPGHDGISAVTYVIYLTTDDGWAGRVHVCEVGIPVR